eukprot:TRINITY_DN11122_c0_g1_i2.p1 TRINITY_DN11122_c0_g1~~TRINITY_DN11122_c0_g1_i2.p1  ORF type:complete len:103 (+),score=17.41 TRINITY_DN11122_c0_g1_i2:27-335(+)
MCIRDRYQRRVRGTKMSCHRCGVAQSTKFCRTCGVQIARGPVCPGCNTELPVDNLSAEKVIQSGKEWHKACWAAAQAPEIFCGNCGKKGRQGTKCNCGSIIT